MSIRVSYHLVAARAVASVPSEKLARAIERMSAAYREGRSLDVHRSAEGRAAYLVHVLPAHVCDQRRLFLDELEGEIRRRELRVVALGAGPGTEAIALADAWATLSSRGPLPGEVLRVVRVDRVRDWDSSFAALAAAALPALGEIDPGAGSTWRLEAPGKSIQADLARSLPEEVFQEVAGADLIVLANLLSEIEPRGNATLPASVKESLAAISTRAKRGAALVILDRAHAPGALARIEAALAAVADARATERTGITEREVRCACSLTRATKALYAKVRLPTTRVLDRPILTTRTAWALARFL
ncbi:hypothetical protein HY251_18195 [bacterium]|nr:hypothetical protein [bacterium]